MRHFSGRFASVSAERHDLIVNVPRKPEIQVDYAPASKAGKAVSSSPNTLWLFKPAVYLKPSNYLKLDL